MRTADNSVFYSLHRSNILKGKVEDAMKHSDKPGEGAKKREKMKDPHDKFHTVMAEFKRGTLRGSDGKSITKRDQAIAIAFSESGLKKGDIDISQYDDTNYGDKSEATAKLQKAFSALGINTENENSIEVEQKSIEFEGKTYQVNLEKGESKDESSTKKKELAKEDVKEEVPEVKFGGHVLGKTASGKNILKARRVAYENKYSSKDHKDAANLHLDHSAHHRMQMEDYDEGSSEREHHEKLANHHSSEFDRHVEKSYHKKQYEKFKNTSASLEKCLADEHGKKTLEAIKALDPDNSEHRKLYEAYKDELKTQFDYDYNDPKWDR